MSRNPRKPPLPAGHVTIPAIAIGALALVLAGGLDALHLLDRLDAVVGRMAPALDPGGPALVLPRWVPWLAGLVFAAFVPTAILAVSGTWRRWVIWITSLGLIVAWAPVLLLAARAPEISLPLVVVLWSGVCALVYAAKHRMEGEDAAGPEPKAPNP